MHKFKLYEEAQRHQWAITPEALRAMLVILETDEISSEDYTLFHNVDAQQKEIFKAAEIFGTPVKDTVYTSVDGNVGYLNIDGPIIPRATWFSRVSGLVSLDVLTNEFKALEKNPRIDKIALLFDSPGGVVTGVSDFSQLVKNSQKETISFVWFAASAAYWIASATGSRVSSDAGMVGSIGTVLSITDYSAYDEKRGIRNIEIVSSQSPNKRPDATTTEGRAVYQQLANELADVFINTVARNLNVSYEAVIEKFGGGAVFVAPRALDAGMIDKIDDAESFAKSIKNGNIMFSNVTSANAELTAEERNMGENSTTTLTAEELRQQYPSAVKEIETSAAVKERDRIQSIESINSKFRTSMPSVKAAVEKTVNQYKFDASKSVADVSQLVLDAVAGAQEQAIEEHASSRRVAEAIANHAMADEVGDNNSRDNVERSRQRVAGLVEARRQQTTTAQEGGQ